MNIETVLSEHLHRAVESAYARRDYTGAILDAVYYLSEVIRERTGLDADGVALVGQAFGGKSPKLKINKLETESERNIQQGVESVLRGFYQAIRNPRSHEKFSDSEQDADSIILFVDFLLRIILQSKSPFEKQEFLDRVFDPEFMESDKYANLIVQDIPATKRVEVFIEVFRKKETGIGNKLRFFFRALLLAISDEDRTRVLRFVEDELKATTNETIIRLSIQLIPDFYWTEFSEAVRMRIENKLILSVKEGKYVLRTQKCAGGALGTWITSLAGYLLLNDQLLSAVFNKLRFGTNEEQDYIFQFFPSYMRKFAEKPSKHQISVFEYGLNEGDKRFKQALDTIGMNGGYAWIEAVQKAYDEFKEAEPPTPSAENEDDVPF